MTKTAPTYLIYHERDGDDGKTYRRRLGGLWQSDKNVDRLNGGWLLRPSRRLFTDGRIVLQLNDKANAAPTAEGEAAAAE